MTDALRVMGLAVSAMLVIYAALGYEAAYEISYGAFTLMAAMVSLTFLWVWMQRATPLAVGMSFGWAGAASVMGWWWTTTSSILRRSCARTWRFSCACPSISSEPCFTSRS
jgi:hypothetical protein